MENLDSSFPESSLGVVSLSSRVIKSIKVVRNYDRSDFGRGLFTLNWKIN